VLEGIVSGVNQENDDEVTSFFQVSRGIVVTYNPEGESGSRLVSVEIGGELLDSEEEYTIVTLDFLAGGGDNFFQPTTDFVSLDTQDEVLVMYIESQSPVSIELEGRIVESDAEPGSPSGGNGTSNSGSEEAEQGADGQEDGQEDAAPRLTSMSAGLVALVVAVALTAF